MLYEIADYRPKHRDQDLQVVIRDVLDGQPGISTIHRNLIAEFKNGKVESHHLLLSAMTAAKFAPQMVAHNVVLTT